MKKCDYCAKEISYHEQYCSEKCKNDALKFFRFEQRAKNIFGIINICCVVAVMIACFTALLWKVNVACLIAGAAITAMGILYIFIPFPLLNLIKKYKLKRSVTVTRIFGACLIVFGICLSLLFF